MLVNKSKLIKKSSQVYRKFIPNKKSKREREREREKSAAQAQRFPALLLATLCSTSNLAVCNILIGGDDLCIHSTQFVQFPSLDAVAPQSVVQLVQVSRQTSAVVRATNGLPSANYQTQDTRYKSDADTHTHLYTYVYEYKYLLFLNKRRARVSYTSSTYRDIADRPANI